jgi:hypothetical protein
MDSAVRVVEPGRSPDVTRSQNYSSGSALRVADANSLM